jgi:hypothetical protein
MVIDFTSRQKTCNLTSLHYFFNETWFFSALMIFCREPQFHYRSGIFGVLQNGVRREQSPREDDSRGATGCEKRPRIAPRQQRTSLRQQKHSHAAAQHGRLGL